MAYPRILLATIAVAATLAGGVATAQTTLLNVSYDPTRELYRDVNTTFAADWQKKTGQPIVVRASHGGSGAQARAVLDGLEADVVTLGLAYDIDALAAHGLLAKNWQDRLPSHSTPYTSTIVFLVRKGNPKGIHDWSDLIRDDIAVITPNPKTSGGARWNYLAAYGWALRQNGQDETKAEAYLRALYQHVPVLDTGARGATNTFVQRGQGDVLLAWENEALLAVRDLGPDKFDVVYPPVSILAEPPVAVVDSIVKRHGTQAAAEAYLRFLFTKEGQEIGARHYFRPRDPEVAKHYADQFRPIETFDVASLGGWTKVQARHFADGGVFDHIYTPK
ncbi:MAG TPA: sulfate ABC transporter substrate-binding protein [Acetobacteraceae bacterium]|nr:sulfate ABC transporter substrate-binding protein [Acetobacteraceae bacterium]